MASELDVFVASLHGPEPVALPLPLRALWRVRNGDWEGAHGLVDDEPGRDAAWVHAHLHRREGGLDNAGYWYRNAGHAMASGSLDDEWAAIAAALLGAGESA
jgi:hypothetical protein